MKKNFTKKLLAAFAVAMLFAGLTQAQILTDYVQSTGSEAIDTVTISSTTRLYVYPDAVFSPSYNATTNAGIGSNQRWTWYNGTDATGTEIKAASNDNWIENTWPGTAQTYQVAVVESNSAVTCDGSATTIDVEVIASPTVTYTSADGSGIFGSSATHTYCENDARLGTDAAQATFTHGMTGSPSFQVQYTLVVDTSHSNGTTWTTIAAMTQTYSGAAGTQQAVTGTTHNLTAPAGGFVCVTDGVDYPTRFTYTLTGVNDRVSRKSDYLSNSAAAATGWSWYDTTTENLVVEVYPVPVTGPIYHISNMWAN
jgi:hypothetical protein